MPIQRVRQEPACPLLCRAILRFCRQVAGQGVEQRSYALLPSSELFTGRSILWLGPRHLAPACYEAVAQAFEPMSKPLSRPAVILVIALNSAARFISQRR